MTAAYRTLDLDLNASAVAIRYQYRELALLHHPDKHKPGSPEQASAATRMVEINAAYGLIKDAPLRNHQPVAPMEDPPREPEVFFERPLGVAAETFVRLGVGALLGLFVAFVLDTRGVPGFWLYGWMLPFVSAFACTTTDARMSSLLRVLLWWT
jgi:hypothetical protein